MSGYLVYHPKRAVTQIGSQIIHHDPIRKSNQDPYIWNTRFLHSYCHITQMSPQINDYIFWVNGNTFPGFTRLYCDLVFVVEEKLYWAEANYISVEDPLVDSPEAFYDHYQWAMYQHRLKRRKRFTLKAKADDSFQPQNGQGELLDIVSILNSVGYTLEDIRRGLRAGWQSKPMRLDHRAKMVYDQLRELASVKLQGAQLKELKPRNVAI